MKYVPLFSIEILHDYYSDHRCIDIQIIPSSETQILFKNYHCLLKTLANGVRILISVNEKGAPLIPLSPDLTFSFSMVSRNPDFALFTDMTEIDKYTVPVFTNSGIDSKLQPGARQTTTIEYLVTNRPAAKEPFILSGKPRSGLRSSNFVIQGLDAISSPDSYDPAIKTITLNTSRFVRGTGFSVTYPITPDRKRNTLGEIEINFKNAQLRKADNEKNFQINFTARQARWKYYVITDVNSLTPTIKDQEGTITFIPDDAINQPDEISIKLAEQYPEMHLNRFISDSPIPCRQTTRKAIQLQLDGEKAVDALPNPSFQNYTIDTRDSAEESGFYHIVKYITPQ